MPQTNYQRGYRLERLAVKQLRDKGYYVIRSAGSHGAADIIALNPTTIMIIQIGVKGRKDAADREMLRRVPAPAGAIREMWLWDSKAREWLVEPLQ